MEYATKHCDDANEIAPICNRMASGGWLVVSMVALDMRGTTRGITILFGRAIKR